MFCTVPSCKPLHADFSWKDNYAPLSVPSLAFMLPHAQIYLLAVGPMGRNRIFDGWGFGKHFVSPEPSGDDS